MLGLVRLNGATRIHSLKRKDQAGHVEYWKAQCGESRMLRLGGGKERKLLPIRTKGLSSGNHLACQAGRNSCKRQGDSEPCADGKLSHLLVIQTIRMLGPASANSAESENSRLPLPECGSDVQADLRGLPSFVHCRRPASTGQRPGSR